MISAFFIYTCYMFHISTQILETFWYYQIYIASTLALIQHHVFTERKKCTIIAYFKKKYMLYETNHYYYISMWRFIIFKILRKTCNFLMDQLIFMPELIKMWYLYRWGLFSKSFKFYGGIFIENLQLGHHLLTNLYSSNLVSISAIHVVFTTSQFFTNIRNIENLSLRHI